jgi:hypothetical protein
MYSVFSGIHIRSFLFAPVDIVWISALFCYTPPGKLEHPYPFPRLRSPSLQVCVNCSIPHFSIMIFSWYAVFQDHFFFNEQFKFRLLAFRVTQNSGTPRMCMEKFQFRTPSAPLRIMAPPRVHKRVILCPYLCPISPTQISRRFDPHFSIVAPILVS